MKHYAIVDEDGKFIGHFSVSENFDAHPPDDVNTIEVTQEELNKLQVAITDIAVSGVQRSGQS